MEGAPSFFIGSQTTITDSAVFNVIVLDLKTFEIVISNNRWDGVLQSDGHDDGGTNG